MGKFESVGVTRGVVSNIEKTVHSIKEAVSQAIDRCDGRYTDSDLSTPPAIPGTTSNDRQCMLEWFCSHCVTVQHYDNQKDTQ